MQTRTAPLLRQRGRPYANGTNKRTMRHIRYLVIDLTVRRLIDLHFAGPGTRMVQRRSTPVDVNNKLHLDICRFTWSQEAEQSPCPSRLALPTCLSRRISGKPGVYMSDRLSMAVWLREQRSPNCRATEQNDCRRLSVILGRCWIAAQLDQEPIFLCEVCGVASVRHIGTIHQCRYLIEPVELAACVTDELTSRSHRLRHPRCLCQSQLIDQSAGWRTAWLHGLRAVVRDQNQDHRTGAPNRAVPVTRGCRVHDQSANSEQKHSMPVSHVRSGH
jgi:hypothetical protein